MILINRLNATNVDWFDRSTYNARAFALWMKNMSRGTEVVAIPKPPVHRVIALQALILLACSTPLAIWDVIKGYSALLGGFIAIAPQAYHAWQSFRYTGARTTGDMVRMLRKGQSGKFLLTGALFAGTFVFVKPLNVLFLFLAFMTMVVVHIAAVTWMLGRPAPQTVSGNE